MIEINNIDDFPKLIPDESIYFEEKDEIRRSPEMNFECSEMEYKCIVEEDKKDKIIKLVPDMNIVMPDKKLLKHKIFKPYMLWTPIAAAAILAFMLIITKNKHTDSQIAAITTETTTETNIIVETKPNPESKSKLEPTVIRNKTTKNEVIDPANKINKTTKKTAPKIEEQNISIEAPENKNDNNQRSENTNIERINSIIVPVETMNKKKIILAYKQDSQETITFKKIDNITDVLDKFSEDIEYTKHNITQILNSLKLPNILNHITLDHGIEKEIDKWAKNNPDIPFDILIDQSIDENKIKEVYDENGTLVKVVFLTNKPLKYKDNKIYCIVDN